MLVSKKVSVSVSVSKQICIEKVLVSVSKKIGIEKSIGISFELFGIKKLFLVLNWFC